MVFPLVLILLCLTFALLTGLNYAFRGDEEHFVSTVELFSDDLSPAAALDYPEVTGPLFYYMFASWGRLDGSSTESLRVFNLIVSLAVVILLYFLYGRVLGNLRIVLWGILLLLLNPYFPGLSMHVFTDMTALLFVVLAVLAVYAGNPLLLFGSITCALLVRQYSIFIVLSSALFFILSYSKQHSLRTREFIALVAGSVPLLLMMILWKGFAPPSGVDRWIISDGSIYRFRYIFIYIIFMAASILPLIIYSFRALFRSHKIVLSGLSVSVIYLFFPVHSSQVTLEQTGLTTVGLMHRFIGELLGNYYLEQFVLWILCWAGSVTLFSMLAMDVRAFRDGRCEFGLFLTLIVIVFLVIMPFSYQVWEKYLVMILPFMVLRLLMMIGSDRKSCQSENN
jgi:hypothetical protein